MKGWFIVPVVKSILYLRMPLAVMLTSLSVHPFAWAFEADESSGSSGLSLARVESLSQSAVDWLKESVLSVSNARSAPPTGACEHGFTANCGYVDFLWFGSRSDEHYEGGFHDGAPNGHGVYTWSDGRRYEGEFRDGQFSGHGIFTWADGNRYEGEWRNSRANGLGKLTTAHGTFDGIWQEGCFPRGHAWIAVGMDAAPCRVRKNTGQQVQLNVVVPENAQRQLSELIACVAVEQENDGACVYFRRRAGPRSALQQ
jgi:hypothetical protein